MSIEILGHPFSQYVHKVLVALYENGTPFELKSVEAPGVMDELASLWPFKLFPVMRDGDTVLAEGTTIIEYLDAIHPGPLRLIPDDPRAAVETRFMDRVFDNHVANHQARIVFDTLREPDQRDPKGVADARAALDIAYAWLDARMATRTWACGDAFTLADCMAGPSLFYAQWTHAIPEKYAALHAYRERLKRRPAFARVLEEAKPWRQYFPMGAIIED